jgi:hypothetical protein
MTEWGLSAQEAAMITEFRDARAAALTALREYWREVKNGSPIDYEALMWAAERLVAAEQKMDEDA